MSKPIRPDHVAIYIRWSTEDQGDGTTLAVQSEACRHYVQSQGWEVRADLVFIDDGYSGGTLERPALTRLRAAVRAGTIDCVVTFKLDRLSRSVMDTVNLVLGEWDSVTHVKSAREPIDTTSAMGKQFFYLLVSYAEWERNVIRERTFSGRLRRAADGRSPGMPCPYGYMLGSAPGLLEPKPAEAPAVVAAFGMALAGGSVRSVARQLTADGYRTRSGRPWATSTVAKMLSNPIYAGRLIWGRQQVNPRHGKAPGEPRLHKATPHVSLMTSTIPPLVPPDLFDQVQGVLHKTAALPHRAQASAHLLTGLIRCAGCGRPLQHNVSKGWRYYRCPGRTGEPRCTAPSLPAEMLETAVQHALFDRVNRWVISRAAVAAETERTRLIAELQARRTALESALARARQQRSHVDQDYLSGRINAAERASFCTHLLAEQGSLTARLDEVERASLQAASVNPSPGWTEHDVIASWGDATPRRRKELLRCFIARLDALRTMEQTLRLRITWYDRGDAEMEQSQESPGG